MNAIEYGANLFLDKVFGSGDPTSIYLGLVGDKPVYADTGSTIDEPEAVSYTRLEVVNNTTNWPAAVGGDQTNGEVFAFTEPLEDWGTIGYVVFLDALTAGNLITYTKIVSRFIGTGRIPRFPVGNLTIKLR